jgi:hypothetical protein
MNNKQWCCGCESAVIIFIKQMRVTFCNPYIIFALLAYITFALISDAFLMKRMTADQQGIFTIFIQF